MAYALFKNRKTPLSYFYPNSNGKVRDILGFSPRSYTTFPTRAEAEEYKAYMQTELTKRELELNLSVKLYKIIKALKVLELCPI